MTYKAATLLVIESTTVNMSSNVSMGLFVKHGFTPWRFRISWVSFGAVPTKYDCWQCVICYMRVCL